MTRALVTWVGAALAGRMRRSALTRALMRRLWDGVRAAAQRARRGGKALDEAAAWRAAWWAEEP